MIECIFTVDYEIYGNGEGSLKELVYEPAEKLKAVFRKWNARCVVFVEAAELEIIGSERTDTFIHLVERQIREFHRDRFEIGLHLHPQWYNARYEDGQWQLDYGEYNLCRLSPDRIDQIIDRSILYLRKALCEPNYKPLSFRAGNWLLQPSSAVAKSLSKHYISVDSSVFKGGVQHKHKLDYRMSLKNGYFWAFSENVNIPDPRGILLEIPTYSKMVPIWKMLTPKRIALHQKGSSKFQHRQNLLMRLADFLRIRHPMKLDFSRLDAEEMILILDQEMKKDQKNPTLYRPIVAIGHTKDLADLSTVESFLSYLQNNGISVSTFRDVHDKIIKLKEQS